MNIGIFDAPDQRDYAVFDDDDDDDDDGYDDQFRDIPEDEAEAFLSPRVDESGSLVYPTPEVYSSIYEWAISSHYNPDGLPCFIMAMYVPRTRVMYVPGMSLHYNIIIAPATQDCAIGVNTALTVELRSYTETLAYDSVREVGSTDELVEYLRDLQDLPVSLRKLTSDIVREAKEQYDDNRFRRCQLQRLAKIAAEGCATPVDEFTVRTEAFLDMCIETLCDAADRVHGDSRPLLK